MKNKNYKYILFILLLFIFVQFYEGDIDRYEQYTMSIQGKEHSVYIEDNGMKIYSHGNILLEEYNIDGNYNYIKSIDIGDIDGDFTDEILLITGKEEEIYGQRIKIYTFNDGLMEIYNRDFTNFNPWKIQMADIDGDKNIEISIGVYKETKFHPIMDKRPYIYNWKDNILFPKWRGSRLSKPFDDYIFVDINDDGRDELVSIEMLKDGQRVINTYRWEGFGFEGMLESEPFDDIFAIEKDGNNIKAYIKEINGKHWIILKYKDNKFITEIL
ncbi:hypothetical protein [Clostridiisalibacter paucivorans]|uniref:hypothetical protein n=1 Tax=Clostridiisalibacter paucivorans TaxID=408753 RepID=UPI000686645D|nr:hypothetical protein [Clostridiisalibacter paucivorans]